MTGSGSSSAAIPSVAAAMVSTSGSAVDAATADLGPRPSLMLTWSAGVLIIAAANTAARLSIPGSDVGFWLGLLLLVVPVAIRVASERIGERERLLLVCLVAVGLYLVKVFNSPVALTFHDELSHWRTANDILTSQHLFRLNPLLPESALYPGLELVATALVKLGGLSIFSAGVLLLGVARLMLALALYMLYAELGLGSRLAAVATITYMANPSFIFFDAQFSYESAALPLAAVTLWLAQRYVGSTNNWGYLVAALSGICAITITHHLTALLLTALLVTWSVIHAVLRGTKHLAGGPLPLAVVALLSAVVWQSVVAGNAFSYLGPDLVDSLRQLMGILSGGAPMRALFRDYGGGDLAVPERLAAYLSILIILVALPFGLREAWRQNRSNPLALALAAAALAYPLSLLLRLTEQGAEASVRSSGFLFLSVGFLLALVVGRLGTAVVSPFRRRGVLAAGVGILFVGGIVLGWAPWGRLPGPYLVSADPRSVEPQGVAAATWARGVLGVDNRIDADRINAWLMGAYGGQRVVTAFVDHVGVWPPFFSLSVNDLDRSTLARGRIRYLVVDRRLSTGLPRVGLYVERGEADEFRHTQPLPLAALQKFDTVPEVSRVYDSGDIVIYDVGVLANEP